MKVLGLILELNPFHNGHKYFISKVKEEINPDLVVAIISTSFTMRGEISVLDKHTKTKLCLENGIDIVLELPFSKTINSSDYYAKNCIEILNSFHITHLAFGSEIGSIEKLKKIKEITNQASFQLNLKANLDKGSSFPQSALKAFMASTTDDELISAYPEPNNTLALSYLNAIDEINQDIIPYTIQRVDNNFYQTTLEQGKLASASAIREAIKNNEDIKDYIFYDYNFSNLNIAKDNLFKLLKYQLLTKKDFNSKIIQEGIENRLLSFIDSKTYDEYIINVSTKRYPINRINRTILSIVIDTVDNDIIYKRILGIDKKGLSYLKKLNDQTIITNTKQALDESDLATKAILQNELLASSIYDIITNQNLKKNEFILQVLK